MNRTAEPCAPPLLIAGGILTPRSLQDQVIVITGAGRSVGSEAARALAWLGANLILVDTDAGLGRDCAARINLEIRADAAIFVNADHTDEKSVIHLARQVFRKFGRVDGVINVTQAAPTPDFITATVRDWDRNYRTNLRGPALMARIFLPAMIQQDYGVFISFPASRISSNQGRIYACFRSAQNEMARALDAELEASGVITFSFKPGKMTPEEDEPLAEAFEEEVSLEAAGAGCAAAVALAPRFRGLEVSAHQALLAAGIPPAAMNGDVKLTPVQWEQAATLCANLGRELERQTMLWASKSHLERQWMWREFKITVGLDASECIARVNELSSQLKNKKYPFRQAYSRMFKGLSVYFERRSRQTEQNIHDPFAHIAKSADLAAWSGSARKMADLSQRRTEENP